ncbi:hypothetical protein J6TS2_33040 [Heyndrickxia sporothermodurans]|nr:hypothetical protein J6TS2_33040 [Heyndrickxia sporothermodurans]
MDVVEIELNICLDSLSIYSHNVITGKIYFSIEDRFFPEKGWEDFVVVILAWWLKALLNLKNSRNGITQVFEFMDGPLFVRGTKISEDIVEMQFIKEKADFEHIYFTCQCSINQLKNTLITTTKYLLKELERRNLESDDIEELERMWKILNN